MGSLKFEIDSPLRSGEHTSQRFDATANGKEYRKSMFVPRYISAWCTSKRKRCFDLALGIPALIFFTPIMIMIGWLIRMSSTGPALFRQERVGLHQQPFVILKFRTMQHTPALVDRGSKVTKQGDPRMTSIGAILRRFKLDELPQLINVIRGEMSFVGPRPKIPQHEFLYMLSRPGITGAATVVFSDEESLLADIPEEFVEHYVTSVLNPEKCRLDSHYIETARFWTDIKILTRTVFKVSNRAKGTMQPMHLPPSRSVSIRPSSISIVRVESIEISSQEV